MSRALHELQISGLIDRRPGSGSFVCVPKMKRQIFGLLIPGLGQPEIFEPVCQGIASGQTKTQHYELLWARVPNSQQTRPPDLLEACDEMLGKDLSGVFFAPIELVDGGDEASHRIVAKFKKAGVPVVLLDRDLVPFPQRSNYDLVGIDNRRAGYVITKHLIDRGCRRIAFVARPNSAYTVAARISGYREALLDADLPATTDSIWFGAPEDRDNLRYFTDTIQPDGIVCANDFIAAVLMKSFQKLGLRIPEDVRLVGIDDVRFAHLLPKPLTTIRQPCFEI